MCLWSLGSMLGKGIRRSLYVFRINLKLRVIFRIGGLLCSFNNIRKLSQLSFLFVWLWYLAIRWLFLRTVPTVGLINFFHTKKNFKFIGYWEGIDPLDGDISHLSITYESDNSSNKSYGKSQYSGSFKIVSASLGFALFCNGEPGISKGQAVREGNKLISDDRVIICLGDESVIEHASPVEIISDSRNDTVILTFPESNRDPIIFHRLSR